MPGPPGAQLGARSVPSGDWPPAMTLRPQAARKTTSAAARTRASARLRLALGLLRHVGNVTNIAVTRRPIDIGTVEREGHRIGLVARDDDGVGGRTVEGRSCALLDIPQGHAGL